VTQQKAVSIIPICWKTFCRHNHAWKHCDGKMSLGRICEL